jgi:hypothetical protein
MKIKKLIATSNFLNELNVFYQQKFINKEIIRHIEFSQEINRGRIKSIPLLSIVVHGVISNDNYLSDLEMKSFGEIILSNDEILRTFYTLNVKGLIISGKETKSALTWQIKV